MNPISHPGIRFPRRTFLRGAGVTMALPWLESIPVWGDDKRSSEPPVRFACLFSGNGFHSKEWWAKGEGLKWSSARCSSRCCRSREDAVFTRAL